MKSLSPWPQARQYGPAPQRCINRAGNRQSNSLRPTLGARVRSGCVAFSRLPVDRVLFEVGIHGAAYRRIEVGGAEAIE
jgi:hypothetical protein